MSLHFCMDPFHLVYTYREKKEKKNGKRVHETQAITTIIKKSTTSLILTVTVWVCIIVCRIMW